MSQKTIWMSALFASALASALGSPMPAHAQNIIATDEPVQAMLIGRTETGDNANMPLYSEELHVTIEGQYASTRLKQVYHNLSNARVEGRYKLQAGAGARVEGFAYWNGEQKIVGEVFEKQTARRIYDSVTQRNRDPGLLEEIGDGVFSFKIFPIAPDEKKRVQIDYTAWLERRGTTVRYRAPIAHSGAVVSVTLKDVGSIGDVRSPTHDVHVDKLRSGDVRVQVARAKGAAKEFVLTYQVKDKPWAARAFVHKDKDHDGYFVLALPAPDMPESAVAPKDVTLVLDRSGSMAGEPLKQAKAAAANVVRRLGPNDRVNVISFDDEVYPLFDSPRLADADARARAIAFIDRLMDGGGTDLALALETALASQASAAQAQGRPRVLLFLTDGQSDSRSTLKAAASDKNDVRVFTVGLGQGVNKPLLSRLAAEKRGRFTYIEGAAAIERDVGTLYRQISRPLLVNLELDIIGARAVRTYPRTLPDLFVEDEILVAGRLVGSGPVTFTLRGVIDGKLVSSSARAQVTDLANRPWVGKLWAQSRVDHLLEELALEGANQELENEVIELALAYNFVTKYTSFLAIPESELTQEARTMMSSARERKREIMAKKADAAALSDDKKGKSSGSMAVGASPPPAPPPPPPQGAPARNAPAKSYDFEDDAIDGDLVAPDGEFVDTRSFASHSASGPDVGDAYSADADEGGSGADNSLAVAQGKGGGCAGCESGAGAGGAGGGVFLFLMAMVASLWRRRSTHTR